MPNNEHLVILKQGVDVWNEWRAKNPGVKPDLTEANLVRAILVDVDLTGANLIGTNLTNAHLHRADLTRASLINAHLAGAHLTRADLFQADLSGTDLDGADFHEATIGWTLWGNVDLSTARGLETVQHRGPSTIGIDTLYISKGNIPEVFLRGAGVTEIAKARQREVREHRQMLFPIRLVSFEAVHDWECFDADTGKDSASEIREYFIPDFSNWKDYDAYQESFQRLLRDLKPNTTACAVEELC